MKILKNKKTLASVAAILVALALIAGSTMAWFVLNGDIPDAKYTAGNLDLAIVNIATPQKSDDDGNYTEWLQPGDLWGAVDGDGEVFGTIENTGNLPIVIKLGSLVVTRQYKDDVFPSTNPISQMTKEANPGVPGAVIARLLFPATELNQEMFSITLPEDPEDIDPDANYGPFAYIGVDKSGSYYLFLAPGIKVDAALVIDMKTNAYFSVLDGPHPELYLDNTYMDCEIGFAEGQAWIATQGQKSDAWCDVFGLTPDDDFAFGQVIDTFSFFNAGGFMEVMAGGDPIVIPMF